MFVVDDNQLIRDNIVKRLSKEGFYVKSFESGEGVLAALDHETPDLVLLDLQMPVLNGGKTIEEMERRGLRIPVAILTAHQELINLSTVTYKGTISLVTKTIELADIVLVTRLAIAGRQSVIL